MQWNTMQNIMHLNSHINIIDAGNVCLLIEDRLKNLYWFLWMMKFYGTFTFFFTNVSILFNNDHIYT